MLSNIRKASCWMDIHFNAGKASIDLIGDLPESGLVWYHKNGIANILSIAKVERMNGVEHVSYHTKRGSKFIFTKQYGTKQYLDQSYQGLHFLDTMKQSSTVMVTTVAAKNYSYSVRYYSRAVSAQILKIL